MDLYIPRKCQETNWIIDYKDNSSVTITLTTKELEVPNEDKKDKTITMKISGFVRTKGNSDAVLNKILYANRILSFY